MFRDGRFGRGLIASSNSTPNLMSDEWNLPQYRFNSNLSRLLDVLISFAALVILLPVICAICVCIMAHDGGMPIFIHRRVGKHGRHFPCLKLRTMVVDADQRLRDLLENDPAAQREWMIDQKLRNDPRITRLGGRSTSSSTAR